MRQQGEAGANFSEKWMRERCALRVCGVQADSCVMTRTIHATEANLIAPMRQGEM